MCKSILSYLAINKVRINLDNVQNVLCFIFCFVIVVDPSNTIFKIKGIVFCALIAFMILRYGKIIKIAGRLILSVYVLILGTFLRGIIIGYDYNYDVTIMFFMAFTPLFLLCWRNKICWLTKLLFPSLVVSVITLFIAFTMYHMPELESIIYEYMRTHGDLILMSRRSFLGYNFIGVFYRSIPLVIIPYSLYCYKFFFEKVNRKKNFVIILLLGLSLFYSGTRANMLSVLCVMIILFVYKLYMSNLRNIAYVLLLFFACSFLCILFMLLSEKGESSNAIKYLHLTSYINLFSNNIDILFCGQGVGSFFYSLGFKMEVTQTEWSYIELIRYVGVFGAILIIGIYAFPLSIIYKNRKILTYAFPFSVGYILFLCIAGTNPLLINSTGMLALLTAYSYSSVTI